MPGTVKLHRVLPTSPEKVYRAFLEADALAKWLPPDGFTCTVHHLEATVGGTHRMSFRNFTTGDSHAFGGEYLELVAGERLVYTDAFDAAGLPGEMRVTVTLKKVSVGTELTIDQEGIPDAIPPEACYPRLAGIAQKPRAPRRPGHPRLARTPARSPPPNPSCEAPSCPCRRTSSACGSTRTPRKPPASTRPPSPTAPWARSSTRPPTTPSGKAGDVLTVTFTVAGIPCLGLNGGPMFRHSEAFSFQIATDDQAETDRLWNAIVDNGGEPSACGWCKDRFGLSWQISPRTLTDAPRQGRRGGRARLRGDDGDGQDRRRGDRRGPARLRAAAKRWQPPAVPAAEALSAVPLRRRSLSTGPARRAPSAASGARSRG